MSETKLSQQQILQKFSSHIMHIIRGLILLYFISGLVLALFPIGLFIIFGSNEPWLPFYIPGIDFNTDNGFIVTSILHLIFIFVGIVGFSFCDSVFIALVLNVLPLSELQCDQVLKWNVDLNKKKPRMGKIYGRMRNFVMMNQEMQKYQTHNVRNIKESALKNSLNHCRYIAIINRSYFLMLFTQILTTAASTIVSVYVIMTVKSCDFLLSINNCGFSMIFRWLGILFTCWSLLSYSNWPCFAQRVQAWKWPWVDRFKFSITK